MQELEWMFLAICESTLFWLPGSLHLDSLWPLQVFLWHLA